MEVLLDPTEVALGYFAELIGPIQMLLRSDENLLHLDGHSVYLALDLFFGLGLGCGQSGFFHNSFPRVFL